MAEQRRCKVILLISDPYVVHHRALSSFAICYLPHGADIANNSKRLLDQGAITHVVTKAEAVARVELPLERLG